MSCCVWKTAAEEMKQRGRDEENEGQERRWHDEKIILRGERRKEWGRERARKDERGGAFSFLPFFLSRRVKLAGSAEHDHRRRRGRAHRGRGGGVVDVAAAVLRVLFYCGECAARARLPSNLVNLCAPTEGRTRRMGGTWSSGCLALFLALHIGECP